jgi:hypothetical protein
MVSNAMREFHDAELENKSNQFEIALNHQLNLMNDLIKESIEGLKSNESDCMYAYNRITRKFPNLFWRYKEKINLQFASSKLEKELLGYALILSRNTRRAMSRQTKSRDCYREFIWYISTLSYVMGIVGSTIEKNRDMSDYGKIRLENDPKQAEKLFVKECWEKWQQAPSSYKNKTKFANDMLEKCEHLTSQKKITDWCREWEVLPLG